MAIATPNLRLVEPPSRELKKVETVLDLIGDTPLLEIRKLTEGLPSAVRVFAKLEGFNPGGSVKDRAALWMVQEGLRTGKLRAGKTILDSTSGNTGIALAMIGRVLGYPVELVVPANVSAERKQIIRAYGAEVTYSDPLEGSDGAIRLCRQIIEEAPEKYFKPDQYFNPMNPQAHYDTTGPEIYRQTNQSITHFVAGIGTGGTVMGAGRYFKEMNPAIQIIAVEPDDALHGLEGLKHMASSIVPGIYKEEELDRKIPVATEDAYNMVYRLSQEEGVLVGQSSGGALVVGLKIARTLRKGTVVVIFPDFGDKYLSTNLWVGWRDRMAVGNLQFSI
jgi:S-sulfo-L-cysteine synthase (O-acetyl-L-serine-dependent)